MKTQTRRRGGEVHDEKGREKVAKHHEQMEDLDHAKHVGEVRGEHGKHTAARAPRKDGGKTGADRAPFSSARAGTRPPGRKEMMED
jgi:hypothetical protein